MFKSNYKAKSAKLRAFLPFERCPRKVLSKAYLRQTVVQKDIENFVTQLKRMLERLNEKESEENHKNLMSDFLKSVYYGHQYEINTKQRHDLVIHLGKSHQDLADKILSKKEKGEDTLSLENEIDQLVYQLYALTPEEIALVEGHI